MRAACRAYRVYYTKPTAEEVAAGDYLLDHSIISYLVDPDGRFLEYIDLTGITVLGVTVTALTGLAGKAYCAGARVWCGAVGVACVVGVVGVVGVVATSGSRSCRLFSAAPLRGFAAYGLGVNAFLALVVLGMRRFIGWRAGDAALAPAPPNKRARTKKA